MPIEYPQEVDGFHRDPKRYPTDGEVLWIDRDQWLMERDPRSNEEVEIIQFRAKAKAGEEK